MRVEGSGRRPGPRRHFQHAGPLGSAAGVTTASLDGDQKEHRCLGPQEVCPSPLFYCTGGRSVYKGQGLQRGPTGCRTQALAWTLQCTWRVQCGERTLHHSHLSRQSAFQVLGLIRKGTCGPAAAISGQWRQIRQWGWSGRGRKASWGGGLSWSPGRTGHVEAERRSCPRRRPRVEAGGRQQPAHCVHTRAS